MIPFVLLLFSQDWSPTVDVIHDETICLRYQARIEGDYLVVRAKIAPGWHTFAMDNKVRATERLAGKRSLGQDKPTSITLTGPVAGTGAWYQSEVKDFSKPEQNWFSWGFENEAFFATKLKAATGPEPLTLTIKGQTCSENTCKNIDVPLTLAGAKVGTASSPPAGLVPVRQ